MGKGSTSGAKDNVNVGLEVFKEIFIDFNLEDYTYVGCIIVELFIYLLAREGRRIMNKVRSLGEINCRITCRVESREVWESHMLRQSFSPPPPHSVLSAPPLPPPMTMAGWRAEAAVKRVVLWRQLEEIVWNVKLLAKRGLAGCIHTAHN